MKLSTPLLQNWLNRFSPTAFFVLSVKVQKAPAQRRGPGCNTKVLYRNLQRRKQQGLWGWKVAVYWHLQYCRFCSGCPCLLMLLSTSITCTSSLNLT